MDDGIGISVSDRKCSQLVLVVVLTFDLAAYVLDIIWKRFSHCPHDEVPEKRRVQLVVFVAAIVVLSITDRKCSQLVLVVVLTFDLAAYVIALTMKSLRSDMDDGIGISVSDRKCSQLVLVVVFTFDLAAYVIALTMKSLRQNLLISAGYEVSMTLSSFLKHLISSS
ncbi:hypothetical protein RIF29_20694 [Crotalaria pallida]|uniref:Uncharacterized protein n=1 Tax=Crotalaria pallida TaxID=3830 RepID=A0AAN9I6K0_CROPI